jgi:hypothetical protein
MTFLSEQKVLIVICALVFIGYFLLTNSFNAPIYSHKVSPICYQQTSNDRQKLFVKYLCDHSAQIQSLIWTHDGSGLMKYLQWIVIRRLASIRLIRLDDNCQSIHNKTFLLNSPRNRFILVYLLSTTWNTCNCSRDMMEVSKSMHPIYFQRRSLPAMFMFQQLDLSGTLNSSTLAWNASLQRLIETIPDFPLKYLTVIYSEDLIHENLTDCTRQLLRFLFQLGFNTSAISLRLALEYDAHKFVHDAVWWDRSDVAERLLNKSIPTRPSQLTYENDFYHLHGTNSFTQYLFDSRRCAIQGIFAQMSEKTRSNRTTIDQPDRCASKPFDCAFSDVYSFEDREQSYQAIGEQQIFQSNSMKCAFAVPSIFDQVRRRYSSNETCQTIIFTLITNCYDPLPEVTGDILSSFCFVALTDRRTLAVYKNTSSKVVWDLIELGVNAAPFSVEAKSVETVKIVGERMFPLARWIIWLDGKARIINIEQALLQATAPFLGAHHAIYHRNTAWEVEDTLNHLNTRAHILSTRFNDTIRDIHIQKKEYQREGFYAREETLGLRMYDIAVFLYRNNHPCIYRYLCAWHNEINYYSFRGQLSVHYAAVRMNLTAYLDFLPNKFFEMKQHRAVC